jgi:GTP-binding protein LepA
MDYIDPLTGEEFILNLIDTPGHIDFTYEVSRSLAAVEGVLLLVDSTQGVQSQTLANLNLALEKEGDMEVIVVINKIDLPNSDPRKVMDEVEELIGIDCKGGEPGGAILCSAKTGEGCDEVLSRIIETVPSPRRLAAADAESESLHLKAMIFDSSYDKHNGVVVYFRVMTGCVKKGDKIRFLESAAEYDVTEVGLFRPTREATDMLREGEVGYLVAGIKDVTDARVGDTLTLASEYKLSTKTLSYRPIEPLPGYKVAVPTVYSGVFPVDREGGYENLRAALGKLKLSDSSLTFVPESSDAMGFGFRVGFLGLLHMEIISERLDREFDVSIITTAPSVEYKAKNVKTGEVKFIDSPSKFPDGGTGHKLLEPWVRMDLMAPAEFTGNLMELCQERRGVLIGMTSISPTRSSITYDLPLAEIITDFHDTLKSRSKGYATAEYKITGDREGDLARLDILVNGELAEPLSTVCHTSKAVSMGRGLVKALKDKIPRQNFR